jgi:hypothetical protein
MLRCKDWTVVPRRKCHDLPLADFTPYIIKSDCLNQTEGTPVMFSSKALWSVQDN